MLRERSLNVSTKTQPLANIPVENIWGKLSLKVSLLLLTKMLTNLCASCNETINNGTRTYL